MSDPAAETGGPTPDPNSAAAWFPFGINDSNGWRLDVVTLLAVIGESSMAEHSQAITASILCLLPRIIPSPQALLKPSRPPRMPEVTAKQVGVYSGVVLDTVGFFANIIHPLDHLGPFEFKVLEIRHSNKNEAGGYHVGKDPILSAWKTLLMKLKGGKGSKVDKRPSGIKRAPAENGNHARDSSNIQTTGADLESGRTSMQGVRRRETLHDRATDVVNIGPTLAHTGKRPAVPAKLYSPIHFLSVFSTLLTAGIIAAAAVWKDGTAIVAIGLISLASSVVGWASWWRPILMNRDTTNRVPRGDVIIRTREGGFILVKCTEEVARELYFGTEECEYRVTERAYRFMMGMGTMMLMVSVILLGNCTWNSQVFIGVSYIVLNGVYWAMGMLPKRYFWDLSRYDWAYVTPKDAEAAHKRQGEGKEDKPSYTRTLWYAIRETQETGWVERSGAAASTPQWKKWLGEAKEAAKEFDKNKKFKWTAVQRKDEIMEEQIAPGSPSIDHAAQAAPAVEVQPRTNPNVSYPL